MTAAPTALIALTTPAPSVLMARAFRISSRDCAVALLAVARPIVRAMLKLLVDPWSVCATGKASAGEVEEGSRDMVENRYGFHSGFIRFRAIGPGGF
ncbi:hypothetical protein [Bradyrhizobium altum]|uniref:hypothetical protein n=1 Tax=Bradyrhizobium altum TaxID=1571202 RepID=UPI001E32BCAC|nr:hypothetical protein [Bradyrhizobium altum]